MFPQIGESPIFIPPGAFLNTGTLQTLSYGQAIRDYHLWDLPILPGAVFTYMQMVSGREWKVSGSTKGAPRAVEYLNRTVVYNSDGTVERGFKTFMDREALDYITIGRIMFTDINNELEYLDPTQWAFDLDSNEWVSSISKRTIPVDSIYIHHPIPIGAKGLFRSPLSSVMPAAMLSWLIREHDRASADGRKVRDITLVVGKELAEQIGSAMQTSLKLWSGANPTESGVPVVYVESQTMKAADHVAQIGLANIPPGFDRNGFEFAYVNEIAAMTGLALRHFWNSEKATNRALEEVQEARQAQKGPSANVRTIQGMLASYRILRKFGPSTRMGFNEEVDAQSRKVNAEVLKAYSEALEKFATVFNGNVNGDAFLGWLQGEGILPADLDILTEIGNLASPTDLKTPDGKETTTVTNEKTINYDEITVDMNGNVVERRRKVVSVAKIIEQELMDDESFIAKIVQKDEKPDYKKALTEARQSYAKMFFNEFESAKDLKDTLIAPNVLTEIFENKENLNDDQYRIISSYMMKSGFDLWELGDSNG
jgi:hypothetical protein